jgi:nitrogen fixation/metabolism regulation signal transduction histidine kinase
MRSVREREQSREQTRGQSREHSSQSDIFELTQALPAGTELEADAAPLAASAFDAAPAHAQTDPVLAAFGEVRSLNTQLQRANDTLHTVNEALRSRVEALRMTTLDFEQMLEGLELGVVLVDSDLTLRHFNSMAAHFLALEQQDVGGSIGATCRGLGSRLAEWCREVLRSGKRIRRTFPSAIAEPLSLQVRLTRVDGERRLILVFAEATESR